MRTLTTLAFLLASLVATSASAGLVFSTSNDDGDMTVINAGDVQNPWEWTGNSWLVQGESEGPVTSAIRSPQFVVGGPTTDVEMYFVHRFSFMPYRMDGGLIRLSIDGGPYQPIDRGGFGLSGYYDTLTGEHDMQGEWAFTGESMDYVDQFVPIFVSLGNYPDGTVLSVEFIAAWDASDIGEMPNWELSGVNIYAQDVAVPEPTTFALLAIGSVLLFGAARRRR